MRTVIVRDAMRIPLGKQGENNAVRVVWPEIAEKYAKLYGEGRFELVVVQRGQVYPAVVNVDGADLVWDVRAADTATAEVGSLELIYYVGDTIAKSQTWETVVVASASAAGTTEPPEDPARVWFDEIKRQIGDLGKLTTKAKENLVAAINEAAQTSSGGADWAQNDPTAKDYIKNRICYEEVVEQWQQLTFNNYKYAGLLQTSDVFVTFQIDGVIYEDVAGEWEGSSTAMYFKAGNYTISVGYRSQKIDCWPTCSSLLFRDKSTVIHQIDDKFIAIKNDNLRNGPKGGSIVAAGHTPNADQVGDDSFAIGLNCLASGDRACATGYYTTAGGDNSHAEGTETKAVGHSGHAEGNYSEANGNYAHAEGNQSKAIGDSSHAEGQYTNASGRSSHAEGENNHSVGIRAHTEGYQNSAKGVDSHAEGYGSVALGDTSHAEGIGTIAASTGSHVEGTYNVKDDSKTYLHIVGNGTSSSKRSNAHTLDKDGNAWFAGFVYVGSTSGTNRDEGSKRLATEDYVDSKISDKELILTSSTSGSTKKFRITVDDNGTISATEVSPP